MAVADRRDFRQNDATQMPKPLYESSRDSPLTVAQAFYERLANAVEERHLEENFVVPVRSGKAWPVKAGQICRIVAIEGPQVVDFNAWNLHNPREQFWAARTKQ